MTTTFAEATPNDYPERTAFAVAAAALVVGMGALQSFQGSGTHEFRAWLIISAIGLAAIGVVLWGILPRIRPTGRAAIVFAVLAVVSVVVFWLNILPSLAAAAILIALAVRRRGETGRTSMIALALATLALVAYVVVSSVG
jgi:hypothetical protein